VDDINAGNAGTQGARKGNRLAVEEDFTRIRSVMARKDFAEGAFAGSVFAHQRVAFAGVEIYADIVKGLDTGESFADSPN
jgi:hypothetical protein